MSGGVPPDPPPGEAASNAAGGNVQRGRGWERKGLGGRAERRGERNIAKLEGNLLHGLGG